MSKQVLIDFGSVRIKEYNSYNHEIETFEEVYNPFKKTTEKKRRFYGYFSTVFEGLMIIHRNELLIDKTQIAHLEGYLKRVEESNEKILKAIRNWG